MACGFLISSPPESKHTPLPTKATNFYEFLFPLYVMFAKTGSLQLALPTACKSLNPSFSSCYPLKIVISQLYSSLIRRTCFTKYSGMPSTSPRPFASSREWFLAFTNAMIGLINFWSFRIRILIWWDFYVFRLNLYALRSKSDAIPLKFCNFSAISLNVTSQDS